MKARSGPRLKSWLSALVGGLVASVVAMQLQNVIRDTWQIRTLPERVDDWLLLFVPLDLFEKGLGQFGADAKVILLNGTIYGMATVLVVIGTLVLRAGWRSGSLIGLGLGLWLFTMAIVMPVTGAGFFATGLLLSPVLTGAGYLIVCLAYATVLVGARLLLFRPVATEPRGGGLMTERRALLVGLIGTLLAGGIARVAGQNGGLVASSLPLAAAPTPVPQPTAIPEATAPVTADATPGPVQTAQPAQPTPVVNATPTLAPLPDPPPPVHVTRDQDGSLTAAGRPKGTLAPAITSNADFYIVTKNAVSDPIVDANTWRLVIDGEVNSPVQLDYRTMVALPSVEITKTLECISNFTAACNLTSYGCDLLSTAVWKGVRLSDVMNLAGGLKSTAVGLAILASDEFTAGLPTDVVQDPDTLVVYQMNGVVLPREHGFPARLLVPGRYGMKNPKWLTGIRAMTMEYLGWYELRNWNKDGIIKTTSRIDVPGDGGMLAPGPQMVSGIAYGGDRGVMKVDISLDNEVTWVPTELLETMPGQDAQVRWQTTFTMPPSGSVTITSRATDGTGEDQTDDFSLPQPDGASGRDQITVTAA